jgi:hypothetical protein
LVALVIWPEDSPAATPCANAAPPNIVARATAARPYLPARDREARGERAGMSDFFNRFLPFIDLIGHQRLGAP